MNQSNKYTSPRLSKGKKPVRIPKGSTLEIEWAKNIWLVNFSFNGKQHRIKDDLNRIKDPKEKKYRAEVLLQSIKNDLKNGWDPNNPEAFIAKVTQENILLQDAINIYLEELRTYARPKTVGSYGSKLRYLLESFPKKQVKSFTTSDIEKYIHGKIHNTKPARLFMNNKSIELSSAQPWTPNTVRSAKGVFRAFFQWCIKNNFYSGDNPVSKVEAKKIRSEVEAKPRHIPFTKADIDVLMKFLDEHDKPLAFFARFIYFTCMRPAEISKLQVKDIDFQKHQLIVPLSVTKNTKKLGVDRIDIDKNLQAEFSRLKVQDYPLNSYLTSDSEAIIGSKSIGANTAYKRFVKALKAVGLDGKGYTLYSFKHFSNIQRFHNGWSLAEIMKANRHSSIAMTENYLKHINRDTDISDKEVPSI